MIEYVEKMKRMVIFDWITIKNYCTLHHLKESAVSNRIRRGALPVNVYLVLPHLNNLKLIQKSYVWG